MSLEGLCDKVSLDASVSVSMFGFPSSQPFPNLFPFLIPKLLPQVHSGMTFLRQGLLIFRGNQIQSMPALSCGS